MRRRAGFLRLGRWVGFAVFWAVGACAPAAAPVPPLSRSAPGSATAVGRARPSYRDPTASVADRVSDLLARMTIEEKVAQLESVNWEHTRLDDPETHRFSPALARKLVSNGIGEVTRPGDRHDARGAVDFRERTPKYLVGETRLGIPALLHEEALHGLVAPGGTSFPVPIALAATFDPDLVEDVFTVAARQARRRGVEHVLAPVLDVARDPRWGRMKRPTAKTRTWSRASASPPFAASKGAGRRERR